VEEIEKIYKSRWQILLFFKNIQQRITSKDYYSRFEDGIVNRIILPMIVYHLTLLIKLELGLKQTIFQTRMSENHHKSLRIKQNKLKISEKKSYLAPAIKTFFILVKVACKFFTMKLLDE